MGQESKPGYRIIEPNLVRRDGTVEVVNNQRLDEDIVERVFRI